MDSSGTVPNNFGQSKSVQIVQIQSRFLPEQGRKYYEYLESSREGWLLGCGRWLVRKINTLAGLWCHDIGAYVCYHGKKSYIFFCDSKVNYLLLLFIIYCKQ